MIAATPAAAPALAALHEAAFPTAERWDAAAIGALLAMPGAFGLHLPGAGFVLARLAADEAEILTLAVAPGARRRGRGGALLAGAMAQAAARGAAVMILEVSEANAAARALYAGFGFAMAGRRRRYYADGTDALILKATLAGPADSDLPG